MKNSEKVKIIEKNEKDERKTAEEMDKEREKTLAYEYLCHLEEAKKWMEACLKEQLPPTTELEENLRNGVYLAKLCHFIAPDVLPIHKIYDIDQKRYSVAGLQFRHTDNINHFLKCLKTMELPLTFQPETTDIYDKKNMPRVIYCIHALSTHLFKQGKAPQIQDLYGRLSFTNEEIDAVTEELKKHGIQMPSFQKIGGLLTNNMAGDTTALHTAVMAINKALSDQDQKTMLSKLQNNAARLTNINPENTELYFKNLLQAKEAKTESALNRSLNDSYVPDVYDELLTQAEIQGHINNVNAQRALDNIIQFDELGGKNFITVLKSLCLQLKNIKSTNGDLYKEQMMKLFDTNEWKESYAEKHFQYCQKMLQSAIDRANDITSGYYDKEEAVCLINKALLNENKNDFYDALQHPKLGLRDLLDTFAMPLYYEELKIDRHDFKMDLSYTDVQDSIRVLTKIAQVSKALDSNDINIFYKVLSCPDIPITVLYENLKENYYGTMKTVFLKRKKFHPSRPMLSYQEIQECVDQVNKCYASNDAVHVLKQLYRTVENKDRAGIVSALKNPYLWKDHTHLLDSMRSINAIDAPMYIKSFKRFFQSEQSGMEEPILNVDDIVFILQIVHDEAELAETICLGLVRINKSIDNNDMSEIITCIHQLKPQFLTLTESQEQKCAKDLINLKKQKSENNCPFVSITTPNGNQCYLNIENQTYSWDRPANFSKSYYISVLDIEAIVHRATTGKSHVVSAEKKLHDLIVRLQARIRGYLLRKKINDRFEHFYENLHKIIKLQRWWRNVLHRKFYSETKKTSTKRGVTEKLDTCLDFYRKYTDKIVKIQAFWRGCVARRDYYSLLHLDKPPFPVVRHFSAILNFTAEDYDKDLQLQHLKSEVVQAIKHNQNLSQQLDNMDIKIGLLIQNRITLQDVIAHGKNLESLAKDKNPNKSRKNSFTEVGGHKGLKSLTKEGRKKLEGYQHLFYALQTNPKYLSKLIFLLPQSKTNKFLQNAILTLFNFGSNTREEYLLLKLLGTALREEIRCKFQKPSEVVTGNPLVLKMALNYAKQLNGQRALRQILGPVIEKLLADKTISIETNPVDIYKCWRNQLEMETGEASDLPYSVTSQQALQYDQVQKRLNKGIRLLQSTVVELLSRITTSRDSIPYGMLYMAKVLNDTLTEKFPQAPEKDILKVVGNLIYYHFINAAIVAPDAFDIVTLPVDRSLSNDQRRNLASIAKILQFAASKKGFGEEATHLVCLNPFIIDCHEQFKSFFRQCCDIEELDVHFSIHEYTEATLIQKPEIYISLQEICDTHNLVLDYQDQIAPDPLDPLHELLEDLGPAPTVASLLGITDAVAETNMSFFGKTEVCIVLSNKFEVPENNVNLNKLFIKTKELLVSVLQFLKGNTLIEALDASVSSPTEDKLCDVRDSTSSASLGSVQKSSSLNDCKVQLRAYLNKLELDGWVSRKDGYQNIVTAVAKDLCNKGKYRILRNQELKTLRSTKQRLDEKNKYYKEQVEYYNEYIQRCLENLHTGKGSLHALKKINNHHSKLKSKRTLKYTAAKLQEKGILLEIDGLPQSQFKNVQFEISPTEHSGVFTVRGKFMGVEMEKINIDIQKLLELQFEGAPIMNIFEKAKINVNLLLYLLNRKYYGKT